MELFVSTILKALILVPMTLLPIINPLGAAPVFVATVGNDRDRAKRLARQIAINSWFVLVASMLIGTYVLALFGISLPVVRVGGGLLLATAGWRMLHTTDGQRRSGGGRRRGVHALQHPADAAQFLSDDVSIDHRVPARSPRRSRSARRFPRATPVMYVAGAIVAATGSLLVSIVLYFVFRNSTRPARLARRNRHAGDDAVDGLHPAVHRHSDHVDRLGRARTE